jgi:hypothetical protein
MGSGYIEQHFVGLEGIVFKIITPVLKGKVIPLLN